MTTRKRTDSAGSSASNKSKEEEEVGHKKAKLEDPVIEDAPNTEDAPKEQDEKSREENTEREDRPPVADDEAPETPFVAQYLSHQEFIRRGRYTVQVAE